MKFNYANLCSSRKFALQLLGYVFGWVALMFGALQLLQLPMPPLTGFCGSWG